MLNIFINSNIDKNIYSWGDSPLILDTKGVVSLNDFSANYYSSTFNGREDLYLNGVVPDANLINGAFIDMFFFKKSLKVAPEQHINIDLAFLTQSEMDFFNNHTFLRGFKLLVIKSKSNNTLNIEDYKSLAFGSNGNDYFTLPKDSIYQNKGVAVQMGNFFKDGVEEHLTMERSSIANDDNLKRNYQSNYINNSDSDDYLTFLIISRRATPIDPLGQTTITSKIEFQLNVYTSTKQDVKLVPFYYVEEKSFLPYLNYQKVKNIMYGVSSLHFKYSESESISGINESDMFYGSIDSLTSISESNIPFSIENPLSKSDFKGNSTLLYYRDDSDISNVSYISYVKYNVLVTKIANPLFFYKEDDKIVFFDENFIKRDYIEGGYLKVHDIKGLTKSGELDIIPNLMSTLAERNKYFNPHLALTCFVNLSNERNFVVFPFNDFKSISSLFLEFSFGLIPNDALSNNLIPNEIYNDFEEKKESGFFNVKLNIYNDGSLLKEINLVHSSHDSSVSNFAGSVYKTKYLVENGDNDFLTDWNSDLKCEVVLSNKKNIFFGSELKPIMLSKIMISGIK